MHKYLKVFLGKEGYDNNCSRIIYEQEKQEKYLTCKLLRAKRAEFFGGKLALVPVYLLYPSKLSVQNTQNKKSRTVKWNFKVDPLNSRTFQGQIHFQGLFKENPKFKDFSRTVGTLANCGPPPGYKFDLEVGQRSRSPHGINRKAGLEINVCPLVRD